MTNKRPTFTDSARLYNNDLGCLSLGLTDNGGFVKISPVFEDMAGSSPTRGEQMYDYDGGVMFGLDRSELATLDHILPSLVSGEFPGGFHTFKHVVQRNVKEIRIGIGIFDMPDQASDGDFQVFITEYEKGKADQPKAELYFVFKPRAISQEIEVNPDLLVLEHWIRVALDSSLGAHRHAIYATGLMSKYSGDGDDGYGRQGGGYQGRPRSGGSSGPRRAYREDEDDGGDEREDDRQPARRAAPGRGRPGPSSGGRPAPEGRRPGGRRSTDVPEGMDNVPF